MKSSRFKISILSTLLATTLISINSTAATTGVSESNAKSTIETKQIKPQTAINLDPIWLLTGGLGAKLEYFLNDTASIGLNGVYVPSHAVKTAPADASAYTYKWSHSEVLVGSNIMLTGTIRSRGMYINPAIGYQNTNITDFSDLKLKGELSSPVGRLTLGYQWVDSQNLRIAFGAGILSQQQSTIIVKDNSNNEVLRDKSSSFGSLALDLQIGYLF